MIAVSCNDERRVLSANATFSERPFASSVVVRGAHAHLYPPSRSGLLAV